jgi:hypothetical protein
MEKYGCYKLEKKCKDKLLISLKMQFSWTGKTNNLRVDAKSSGWNQTHLAVLVYHLLSVFL